MPSERLIKILDDMGYDISDDGKNIEQREGFIRARHYYSDFYEELCDRYYIEGHRDGRISITKEKPKIRLTDDQKRKIMDILKVRDPELAMKAILFALGVE